jgi:hypothetical protein
MYSLLLKNHDIGNLGNSSKNLEEIVKFTLEKTRFSKILGQETTNFVEETNQCASKGCQQNVSKCILLVDAWTCTIGFDVIFV